MTLGKRKRFAVLSRDKFTCHYCGRAAPAVVLNVDHVIPKSKGGTDSYDNLVTACRDCNYGKSGVLPDFKPQDILDPRTYCRHCNTSMTGRVPSHTWDYADDQVIVICPMDEYGQQHQFPSGWRKRTCYNQKHWRRHENERHHGICQSMA